MIATLFWLACVHALTDFSLQTDAMAKGKNRHAVVTPPPGQKLMPCWYYWLSAHALIAGGAVALVVHSPLLGFIYGASHWVADFCKCENWTNPNTDQAMHGAMLLLVALLATV